ATLYELLTLQPAFPGDDAADVVYRVVTREPTPPRTLNRAVPRELETIVLKALTKEPAERYQSASELADDLRFFLDDRPIRARRPSAWQRLQKWARRHQAVVLTGTAGLALAVVLLAVFSLLLWQAYKARGAALGREAKERARAQAGRQKALAAYERNYNWMVE